MVGIIVTQSDTIPTKKVVKILGNVSVKKVVWVSESPERCYEELKKKAEMMGADAIINVSYHSGGTFGIHESCSGIAVKLEDDELNMCPKCNKKMPEGNFSFCPHCGTSVN